jgi:hypothetical protein
LQNFEISSNSTDGGLKNQADRDRAEPKLTATKRNN